MTKKFDPFYVEDDKGELHLYLTVDDLKLIKSNLEYLKYAAYTLEKFRYVFRKNINYYNELTLEKHLKRENVFHLVEENPLKNFEKYYDQEIETTN